MKIVFMGTPDFAVPTLTEIVMRGHDVLAVYTRAPKPAGRGQAARKSPVHEAAEGFGLPVMTPANFRDQSDIDTFTALGAEVAVVVAYGLLLPKPLLDAPREGGLNLHGSLLPRWRGAAPIQRAVMAGDTRTAATVMRMEEGLDTGPIGLLEEIPIGAEMSAGELHDEMMRRGADLMGRALAALERGGLEFTPQPEDGVTYAKKIEKREARIDFSAPAKAVHDHIRGLSPFPGAFFEIDVRGKPVRLKVLRAAPVAGAGTPGTVLEGLTIACGQGAIRLDLVQREGKGTMDAEAFLRGAGDLTGAVAG